MNTIDKTYVLPVEVGRKMIVALYKNFNASNSRKIGKHRRGSLRLVDASGRVNNSEYTISIRFAIKPRPAFVIDGKKHWMIRCVDYRKLLRKLARYDLRRGKPKLTQTL